MTFRPDAQVDQYARRLLSAQDVQQGPLRYRANGGAPIPPATVAAVLHALADQTHNLHMVNVIIDGEALAADRPGERALSLGRYFHALGDSIDDIAAQGER